MQVVLYCVDCFGTVEIILLFSCTRRHHYEHSCRNNSKRGELSPTLSLTAKGAAIPWDY